MICERLYQTNDIPFEDRGRSSNALRITPSIVLPSACFLSTFHLGPTVCQSFSAALMRLLFELSLPMFITIVEMKGEPYFPWVNTLRSNVKSSKVNAPRHSPQQQVAIERRLLFWSVAFHLIISLSFFKQTIVEMKVLSF